jgi:hypothetical protein
MQTFTSCADCAATRRTGLREADLPACVRDLLQAARAARPDVDLICLSYRLRSDGQEIVRIGSDPACTAEWRGGSACPPLHPKQILVLSATATETTFEDVKSVTHVLVARMHRRKVNGSDG